MIKNPGNKRSPLITRLSWGDMIIDGIGNGKDFKLWPGGGREWDWSETGTHHVPGIQPVDVIELLEHGAREIVLSRGMLLALQTCEKTRDMLTREGIPYHVCETREASGLYNRLVRDGAAVGGLFHSTC